MNKDDRRRPSESGSVTSSAVTSSVAGNSSAATEETNVSWNSSAHHLEKVSVGLRLQWCCRGSNTSTQPVQPTPCKRASLQFCLQHTVASSSKYRTRNSAIADKPARRVYRSVKVTKHSTIPYARYSFLLCNSNFVFKTRRFYDIRLQKCRDLEIGVRGHSRSLKVAPFDRLSMVSY